MIYRENDVKPKLESAPARLVGVVWGEDCGVVDLDTAKVIMYVNGDDYCKHFNIPTVEIEDEDFRPLVADDKDDLYDEALYEVAEWSNVPALLTLSSFNLADRLYWPGLSTSKGVGDGG